jgi:Zn-dependent protease with chaperone function
MKAKLLFASTLTLGILFSFVFMILLLVAYFANAINAGLLIGLTVLFSFIGWLISPWMTDLMLRWFYKAQKIDPERFSLEHPELADFLNKTTSKHKVKIPALFIIEDRNPTAFCYGSYVNNSRLVVSRGIFEYLDIEEQKAVYGHELGHIINRDFIIMTVATTLLQVLYEVYVIFCRNRRSRSSSGKSKDITPLIGLVSYIFWIIGSYLILYLSRTREYLADRFSAENTGNPNALSMALVKIAYGIAAEPDTEGSRRLLVSTRAMGIYDYKSADSVGGAFGVFSKGQSSGQGRDLSKIFWFDIFSPWAKISEFSSTHPLTGKRVKALSETAREIGQEPRFDFASIEAGGRAAIDRSRLYNEFYQGVLIYFLPPIALCTGLVFWYYNRTMLAMIPVIFGFGFLAQGLYKFQMPLSQPEKTTVFDLMCDPYASPLKGRFVEVEGEVIGKAQAGSWLGEDVTMQDRSGGLIYLNYESLIPLFGNLFFALTKANHLIGKHCISQGWFRRSTFQIIDVHAMNVDGQTIPSYTRFWGLFVGFLLILAGVAFAAFTFFGQSGL